MANAPSTMKVQGLHDIFSGIAASAFDAGVAGLLAVVNTSEQLDLCGADVQPTAIVVETYASGALASAYRIEKGARALLKGSGTIAAGDFFKAGAAGVIVAEGTPTTYAAATTVGKIISVAGTNAYWCEFIG